MSVRNSIGVLLPLPLTGRGVGYTCGALAKGAADRDFAVTVVTPRSRWPLPSVEVIEALPNWARYVPYRWVREKANRQIESVFLSWMDRTQTPAAYLWPDASSETLHELKRRNVTIFREQYNCHTGTAKRILDDAYERLGVAPAHGITDRMVEREKRILESIDYLFCPNPLVESSMKDNGVPPRKLLQASYGWDPLRFAGSRKSASSSHGGITAVFVGIICVRKGAHLLLDYWARSGVKGRLILAGRMEPTIKDVCGHHLSRNDVTVLDYVEDVGSLYRSADLFVFPSLEEGGPQVTYEACGCGLPAITTDMGAGRIVRHKHEGFVLDPYDAEGWISAIRDLAKDAELRKNMADAAFERARDFTWEAVAGRRRQQIIDRLADDDR
jgi:glycosyltransferase involved in cell wall biosynthesis